ncbi:MAG TPA: hypothetical protein VFA59_07120 [Vicinamibacterales bacterium]|nr:hypothetical protein [Vicinamibacterales bacterium]
MSAIMPLAHCDEPRFQYVEQQYRTIRRPPLEERDTACIEPPQRSHRLKPVRK